jgi:hypothetical protein
MTFKINTYCPNDSMGNLTDRQCNKFRETLLKKLGTEYPSAQITVSSEPGNDWFVGFDSTEETEIIEFIQYCWDYQ